MIRVGDLSKCYGGSRYKHDATAMNARYRGEYKRVVHANGVMLQHVTSRAVMTYERRSCTTQESMEAEMTCKGTLRKFLGFATSRSLLVYPKVECQCYGHSPRDRIELQSRFSPAAVNTRQIHCKSKQRNPKSATCDGTKNCRYSESDTKIKS